MSQRPQFDPTIYPYAPVYRPVYTGDAYTVEHLPTALIVGAGFPLQFAHCLSKALNELHHSLPSEKRDMLLSDTAKMRRLIRDASTSAMAALIITDAEHRSIMQRFTDEAA